METRTRAREFLQQFYPELSSQPYHCSKWHPKKNCWWFGISPSTLEGASTVLLLGKTQDRFQVFRVPIAYLDANLALLSRVASGKKEGTINLHIHTETHIDLRASDTVTFAQFALN